jgi:hypothetical protein
MTCKAALISILLLSAMVATPLVAQATLVTFQQHHLSIAINPETHLAEISDEATVTLTPGWNGFYLRANAEISRLTVAGEDIEYVRVTPETVADLPTALQDNLPPLDPEMGAWPIYFETTLEGAQSFEVTFSAEFFDDVSNTRFSNEKVGGEISGTILEKGAYLDPSSHFYPQGAEEMSRFKVTARVPAEWESISDGNQLADELVDGVRVQTWENPYESDGIFFFAAPFVTESIDADGVEVACYFFEEDTALIADYLEATARYITMYSELIGPYPFERFTVVENFFPTGYGMPGWTLLGQQVLRLPFIKHTSLGHEVLHNWWGNSIYVDYAKGNWCEGITVYGADYRYKLLQSDESARDYRKDILNQYLSYVNEGNDFPIREFTSRTSPSTRTIGYNKTMMVFHMIENEIGTEAFFDAWRLVNEKYQGARVSWEQWLEAYEAASGKSLAHVIPQWIDRTGAPVLAVEAFVNDSGQAVITLQQTQPELYRLMVPLRFVNPELGFDKTVLLEDSSAQFVVNIPPGTTTLTVDPDFSIFRRLYPDEIEPIVSSITGQEDIRFYCLSDEGSEAWKDFGANMTGVDSGFGLSPREELESGETSFCPVLLNPDPLPEFVARQLSIDGDSLTLAGVDYPRAGHTLVLSGQNWRGFERYLVVLSDDFESLPRIGQLLPHYGKYSYLAFSGAKNIGKGKWLVDSSPLKIELTRTAE